jgi:hypothetical protein
MHFLGQARQDGHAPQDAVRFEKHDDLMIFCRRLEKQSSRGSFLPQGAALMNFRRRRIQLKPPAKIHEGVSSRARFSSRSFSLLASRRAPSRVHAAFVRPVAL